MNIQTLKAKIKCELLDDLNERNFKNNAQLVNFFYDNYLNKAYFNNAKEYNFLIKSDRGIKQNLEFYQLIYFLVENRYDFLDFPKLESYGLLEEE